MPASRSASSPSNSGTAPGPSSARACSSTSIARPGAVASPPLSAGSRVRGVAIPPTLYQPRRDAMHVDELTTTVLLDVHSPTDGTRVASVPAVSAEGVAAVAARLRAAQPDWER